MGYMFKVTTQVYILIHVHYLSPPSLLLLLFFSSTASQFLGKPLLKALESLVAVAARAGRSSGPMRW